MYLYIFYEIFSDFPTKIRSQNEVSLDFIRLRSDIAQVHRIEIVVGRFQTVLYFPGEVIMDLFKDLQVFETKTSKPFVKIGRTV